MNRLEHGNFASRKFARSTPCKRACRSPSGETEPMRASHAVPITTDNQQTPIVINDYRGLLVSKLQSKSNISLHSKISIPLVIATVVRSYAVWRNHRDIARRFQSRTREFCFAEPWHRPRCIRLQAPKGSFLPPPSGQRADSQS